MVLIFRTVIAAGICLAILGGVRFGPSVDGSAAAAGPAEPRASTLRGRVDVRSPETSAGAQPGIAELGADLAYEPAERRRAVVYLETAPQGAFEQIHGVRATMKQEHETFVPHVLAIQAGSVVDFPNADPFFHNVFSLSKTKRFDLGRYPRGHSKSVRFDEPGLVRVFCDIHSHMSAFILVFAHRFFAVTDDQGRYRIEGVPPGPCTVVAWYEGAPRSSRQVTVPAGGGSVDVDFTIAGR